MTEEDLSAGELRERALAVIAAAAEDRDDDISELLATLPWDDLISVVYGVASLCAAHMAGSRFPPDPAAMALVADHLRGRIARCAAERTDGP